MEASDLLRTGLMYLAESTRVRDTIEKAPVSRSVVRRFVPGARLEDAVRATGDLALTGRTVTIDYLGEDTLRHRARPRRTRDAYLDLAARCSPQAGSAAQGRAEVSVKLSALGRRCSSDGRKIALENAREICQAAAERRHDGDPRHGGPHHDRRDP